MVCEMSILKVLAIDNDDIDLNKLKEIFSGIVIINHASSIENARDFLGADYYDIIFLSMNIELDAAKGMMLAQELHAKIYPNQGQIVILIEDSLPSKYQAKLKELKKGGDISIVDISDLFNPLSPDFLSLQNTANRLRSAIARRANLNASTINVQPHKKSIVINESKTCLILSSVFIIFVLLTGWMFIPEYILGNFKIDDLYKILLSSIPAAMALVTMYRGILSQLASNYLRVK